MKNKTLLRFSFIAVALLMLASCVTLAVTDTGDSDATVGDTFTSGKLNFESTGEMGNIGTAKVIATTAPYGYTGAIVIPATVSNEGITYTVTSIDESTFASCSALTSITIPSGVTSIGNNAFYQCSGLTSIAIPSGVTSIGEGAFSQCSGLTSIAIPSGVTSIGASTFASCSALTSITIPSGVTSIGEGAFKYCTSLNSIAIPSGVTSIPTEAFSECTSLTSVTIPAGVTSIGNSAFSECTSLTSVTIPAGVTTIDIMTFGGCTSLTSVTIPAGVTTIGNYAFTMSGLNSITIPSSVTSIGNNAFAGTKLTSITIPSSVTSIGVSAFRECTSLTSVTIPAGVTSIGVSAFQSCRLYTAHVTDYTAATIAGTPLTAYMLTGQGALTHVKLTPKTASAITIDTTPYRVTGKYLTITDKHDNVTVQNFAVDWKAGTPYTWNGTAWVECMPVTWTVDAQRTVTTVVKPGETPAYYWTMPSGFLGWSPSMAAGTNAYTAQYAAPSQPDTPVTPVQPGQTAKPFDILDYKVELALGVLALILTIVIVVGFRSPLVIVADAVTIVALLAMLFL